jgi:Lecithin retinol acyltransferase
MQAIFTHKITINNGNLTSPLYRREDSGRVIHRDKIGSIINTKHTGIILGQDRWSRIIVAHNHYESGKVDIVVLEDFANGKEVHYDDRAVKFDPLTIVSRALDSWLAKDSYHFLINNCQHFVNNAAQDEHYSEQINSVSDFAMGAGAFTALLGLLSGNNKLVALGAGIAGVGAIGKISSND